MSILYAILLGIDLLAAGVAIWFFLPGLTEWSVDGSNALLWLALLGGIAAVLYGGVRLRAAGAVGAANLVLLLLALPATALGVLILALILFPPRWH